jgi:hypothetical protein
MQRAMSEDAPQSPEIEPVDIQRLLVWYYGCIEPGRPRIRRRSVDPGRPAALASAGI